MTTGSFMKAKSIASFIEAKSNAECSLWSILQSFWPAFSDYQSRKPYFGLFESVRFTQVLLYQKLDSALTRVFPDPLFIVLAPLLYPPQTLFVVGILFSRCPSVLASVRASVRNVLFFKYLEESLLDFHQTLQICSYMQDKYFRQKSKG